MPLGRYNMSDTPQNETDNAPEDVELSSFETNDSIPHSEGGEQVQAESIEQVDEAAVAQEKANAAFNKQYGEKKQLERDLAAQREENSRYQQAERERQAAAVGNIPPMPDSFDEDFDVKVRQRDEAIIASANYNAQNSAYLQQEQHYQQQTAQAAQQKQAELATSFTANAKKTGATDEEFNSVVSTLNNGGMTPDIGSAIMSDPDGYFIAKHLAANPQEAHELNTMNPILAGAKFAELKQKASALKPKTSNAPSPATNLQGNGVDPEAGKHKYLSGATFE
jgi:hypothetical protein